MSSPPIRTPSRAFKLPTGPRSSRPGTSLSSRIKEFLLHRWAGRLFLLAVPLLILELFGLRPFGDLPRLILVAYVLAFGCWLVLRIFSGRLFYKIRTKLIVSYLFIGLVPIFLLTALFMLQALIVLYAVGAYVVTAELDTTGARLQAVADTVLAQERNRDLPRGQLEMSLGATGTIHPGVSYAVVDGGKVVTAKGSAPKSLPAWFEGTHEVGPVTDSGMVLRAIAREGDAFVVLDAPVDAPLFGALPARGLTFHSSAEWSASEGDPEGAGSTFSGIPLAVTLDVRNWTNGSSDIRVLVFQMDPRTLVGYLSSKGFRTPDIVRWVLIALGIFFLVVYAIAVLLGWLLARSITRSVYELSRGTERLRGGDFDTPIHVTSRDQLGELGESFNLMSAGIQDLLREQGEKERLEEELRIARRIQMSLLPEQGAFQLPGVRVAALCLPAAEVGGDYYDLLPLGDGRMGVLVADVSGKGTSAALYMAELKGLVLSLSRVYDSPARLLSEANRILAATLDSRSFVTMTYAVVDAGARRMSYARAGHNPILRFDHATGETEVLFSGGLGLGLDNGDRFDRIIEERHVTLDAGDVFLFFTDGLSEAMNEASELYGENRLRSVLASVRSHGLDEDALKDRILEDIRAFVGSAAQHDDMTMVVLKVA